MSRRWRRRREMVSREETRLQVWAEKEESWQVCARNGKSGEINLVQKTAKYRCNCHQSISFWSGVSVCDTCSANQLFRRHRPLAININIIKLGWRSGRHFVCLNGLQATLARPPLRLPHSAPPPRCHQFGHSGALWPGQMKIMDTLAAQSGECRYCFRISAILSWRLPEQAHTSNKLPNNHCVSMTFCLVIMRINYAR